MDLKFNNTMKKIFLTFATAALFSVSAFAVVGHDKTAANTANISYTALHSFDADFTDAQNVVWTKTPDCQKVDFTENGEAQTAFYNLSGDFLGTTRILDYSIVPARTKQEIAEKYKGYVASNVILYHANTAINDNIDPVTYFVVLKKADRSALLRVTSDGDVEFFKEVK